MRFYVLGVLAFSLLSIGIMFDPMARADVVISPPLRGCPSSGFLRLVNVSTSAELSSAVANAKPGDEIKLAAGSYAPFSIDASHGGTASAPVIICGDYGVWPRVGGGAVWLQSQFLKVTGILFQGPNNSQNSVNLVNSHDVLFSGNEIKDGDFHAGVALDTDYNVQVIYNYIHDNGVDRISHGIYYRHQAGPNIVANNVIVNNYGRGISMHDNNGYPITDQTVVHNTIVRNGTCGLQLASNGGSGNVVANNVLSENGWRELEKQIRIVVGPGGGGGANSILNNIVWSADSTLAGIDYQETNDTITGNLIKDPLFVTNFSDLHLQSASPAIGLADPTYSVILDYDGAVRDANPDSGAYEYGAVIGSSPTPTSSPSSSPTPSPSPTVTSSPSPAPSPSPSPTVTSSPSPTPTATSGSEVVKAAADAYTSVGSPSKNFGPSTKLMVDGNNGKETNRAYLRFSFSGVSSVKKATLRLHANKFGSCTMGPAVYLTGNSWSESSIDWSNQPAAIGGVLDSVDVINADSWVDYDVTAVVSTSGTYSFVLIPRSDDSTYFASREASSNQPELIIEY